MKTHKEIILHIGYHKTATTFLQQRVFSKHSGICYLGCPWVNSNVDEVLRELKYVNDLDYEPTVFIKTIRSLLASNVPANNDMPVVISLESLHSGSDWFGRNVVQMCNRISDVFSGAKVIIGIRNQADYIISNYSEYVIHGGKLSLDYFIKESFAFNESLLPKLKYDKVVSLYQDKFGKENVYVCLQEKLRDDPMLEINRMFSFMGVGAFGGDVGEDVYKGMGRVGVNILRYVNLMLAKDFSEQYYQVGRPYKFSINEKIRRRAVSAIRIIDNHLSSNRKLQLAGMQLSALNEIFKESNRELSKYIGEDLEKYGYLCS